MTKVVYLLIVFFFYTGGVRVYPETVIITNPDTNISTLKIKEVKDIYTGKRTRWNGSGRIILVTLTDSEVHREFLWDFLKKTPTQFRNYWRRKVFTGEGKNPKAFDSEARLIDFVAQTKGALGYVSAEASPGGKGVKIIRITDSKGGSR